MTRTRTAPPPPIVATALLELADATPWPEEVLTATYTLLRAAHLRNKAEQNNSAPNHEAGSSDDDVVVAR